jgi:plastocyanin
MGMRRTWLVIGLVATLALGSACGSDDGAETSAPGTSAADDGEATADATVVARDFEFAPSTVTIPSGGTIEVTNEGGATHSFTMDDDSVTEDIDPGATVTVTVPTAGAFHCRFHAQMTGTVEFG